MRTKQPMKENDWFESAKTQAINSKHLIKHEREGVGGLRKPNFLLKNLITPVSTIEIPRYILIASKFILTNKPSNQPKQFKTKKYSANKGR